MVKLLSMGRSNPFKNGIHRLKRQFLLILDQIMPSVTLPGTREMHGKFINTLALFIVKSQHRNTENFFWKTRDHDTLLIPLNCRQKGASYVGSESALTYTQMIYLNMWQLIEYIFFTNKYVYFPIWEQFLKHILEKKNLCIF